MKEQFPRTRRTGNWSCFSELWLSRDLCVVRVLNAVGTEDGGFKEVLGRQIHCKNSKAIAGILLNVCRFQDVVERSHIRASCQAPRQESAHRTHDPQHLT